MFAISRFLQVLLLWTVVAVVLAVLGIPERMPPAALSLVLAWLAFAAAGAAAFHHGVRRWLAAMDPRRLVLLHGVRWVGAVFLLLQVAGELPASFAWLAGVGDSLIALGAVVLLRLRPDGAAFARGLRAWNVAGLIDLLAVVAVAIRLSLGHPGELAVFHTFPFSLLPLVVAPVLVASHVALFEHARRLEARRTEAAAGEADVADAGVP